MAPVLFPVAGIAAIVTEIFCYRRFSSHPELPGIHDVIGANPVSWMFGMVADHLLPHGWVDEYVQSRCSPTLIAGPNVTLYVVSAFPGACILSIIIEGLVLQWTSRNDPEPLTGIHAVAGIANVASYPVMIGVAFTWNLVLEILSGSPTDVARFQESRAGCSLAVSSGPMRRLSSP